ncbi:MAG: hypothetical protein GX442_15190 [Candidatus Riflebacteria bacterium]|nr:hypothetical protein [Candidatus Riflebacteria bacterium]
MSILAVGFFGEGNLGDEAILEGLAASLPAGFTLTVTAGSRPLGAPAARMPRRGLTAWPAFLRALRGTRQVVFTGGMLQDWSFDGVVFYALRMLASSLAGRRPGLWGVGLGPLRHPAARGIAARLLRHAGPVWVRNEGSARLFRELTGRPARLGCDWSWAIPDPSPDQASPAGEPGGRPPPPAGADDRPVPPLTPPPASSPVAAGHDGPGVCHRRGNVLPDLAGAVSQARPGRPDGEGSLLPPPMAARNPRFTHGQGATRPAGGRIGLNLRPWMDGRFLEQARQAFGGRPPRDLLGVAARTEDARLLRATFSDLEVREPASFTELMRLGRGLSEGWAMRFHVVLAWLRAGLPVVPLAYDDKVDGLCREIRPAGPGQPPAPAYAAEPTTIAGPTTNAKTATPGRPTAVARTATPAAQAAAGHVRASEAWVSEAGRRLLTMRAALWETCQAG